MVPYYAIDSNAPFSVALGQFYPWASYIVSLGACAGTFNTAFASLYAMSRLVVVMSRCRLIPEFLVSWQLLLDMPACSTPAYAHVGCLLAFLAAALLAASRPW
jgi:amino acid transporter